jgi:hypothetical protein
MAIFPKYENIGVVIQKTQETIAILKLNTRFRREKSTATVKAENTIGTRRVANSVTLKTEYEIANNQIISGG